MNVIVRQEFELKYDDLAVQHISHYTIAQSAGAVECTDFFSAEGLDSPTSVLDTTLSNLIVKLQ